MRLVDNDEVIRIVREEVKDEDNTLPVQFRAGVDYVLKIIGELPTVEAIPIEWLRMWFTKKASLIGITLMGEIESDWEKENGNIQDKQRND